MRFHHIFCGTGHRQRVALFLLAIFSTAVASLANPAATAWLHRSQAGDVAYFTFAAPARIERYDMAAERWLSPIPLSKTPDAFAADPGGIAFAQGTNLYVGNLDGSDVTLAYGATSNIRALLLSPDFVVAITGARDPAVLSTIRRSDRQFVDEYAYDSALWGGFAIGPASRTVYAMHRNSSGGAGVPFTHTGAWPKGIPPLQTKTGATFNRFQPTRAFVSPDDSLLFLEVGHILAAATLEYRGSLAGAYQDLAFHENTPIVLRDNVRVVAFNDAFLESGTAALPKPAQGIAIANRGIFSFSAEPTAPSGIVVSRTPIESLTRARADKVIDPTGLSYVPDKVLHGPADTLFLYSRVHQSVFRWSAVTGNYVASLRLRGAPSFIAYSPALDRLYTGYPSGEIHQIKLDQGRNAEEPFANLPVEVTGLHAAGPHLFATSALNASPTRSTYSADGALLSFTPSISIPRARDYVWSKKSKRLYHYRDGTSPDDIHYTPVSETGEIGRSIDSPYHGKHTFSYPLRLSSDEAAILTGEGHVFDALDLRHLGSLAYSLKDGVSVGGLWRTIRASGSTTQLQFWTSDFVFERGLTLPGHPLSLFVLSDGRLLALTTTGMDSPASGKGPPTNTGGLIFSYVDPSGSGPVATLPYIKADPASCKAARGFPAKISVEAVGAEPLAFEWKHAGKPLPGANSATYTISSVTDANAGDYVVKVTSPHGSVTSAIATLTVIAPLPAPVITRQPTSFTAIPGAPGLLQVTAQGEDLTYQWYHNGLPIPGENTRRFYVKNVTENNYGDYTVAVSTVGPSITSVVAQISPPPPPLITAQPASTHTLLGGTARFSVEAHGALRYQWRRNGTPIEGEIRPRLSVNVTTPADFGTYDVIVTNMSGSVLSSSASLNQAVPPTITVAPESQTVPLGKDATFTLTASGEPATLTYQWQRLSATNSDWVSLGDAARRFSGTTTATLRVFGTVAAQNGLQLRCVVGNGFGQATTSPIVLSVVEEPSGQAR